MSSATLNDSLWRVPLRLDDVPEGGRYVRLEADAEIRAAVAKALKLRGVDSLAAEFEVTRRGADGLRVRGRVAGVVGQECVVSLEPLTNSIDEPVDVEFSSKVDVQPQRGGDDEQTESHMMTDGPEPLIGGTVDLGALAVEFLLLGVDPYPRNEDAAFETPSGMADDAGPFAALAALKKKT